MKKIIRVVLIVGVVGMGYGLWSLRQPASRPVPPALKPASPILFDQVLAREDIVRRLKEAEQDLATDEWSTNRISGRVNNSRSNRIWPISKDVLDEVEPQLEKMNAGELLAQLKTFPLLMGHVDRATTAYDVYVMGNRKIIALLDKRPKREFEALRKYKDDLNETFDGLQGCPWSIGSIIRLHLGEL
jgi:hypothetical protein